MIVGFGVAMRLDQRWPEDWTERWRIHQAKVNLIPGGMINLKFEHSNPCIFLFFFYL